MTPRNIARSRRAQSALTVSGYWDEGDSSAVVDILSDLRHLCERHGFDFADCLRVSGDHYAAEAGGDDA